MRSRDIELIGNVMFALENYKPDIFTLLFGEDKHKDYRAEWLKRSAVSFWLHLDSQNRAKVVDWVKDRYGIAT